ncbi:MAG: AbrB/MazE/SpoVT family DNA-binding domain-containing protein [Anaerolineales bacterium]|uniref:AbrB/MazE/SpoVT family DNA-binding domain-containing protein n=1 Tax=Candidatus Desulfolinea nitratireducens TaxID=2841698 RepID=A0A8J6NQH4_9CHLR|nr:AbrB/MazE/SpoVT family DNA-binding domain-containing protein [Candidatus Desulfolinea nitratireducens]MBL6961476.1 AbrB/MazE/SpoVT family DNA-binding domain-containing protein [Anaerolineales bacterium]
MSTTTLQIRKKGTITLPADLRRKYNLAEGEALTLIDLGDGSFLLSPRQLQVDKIANQISTQLEERGETLESMLLTLREVREDYATKKT